MGADQLHDWQQLAASALDWWCESGVDTLAADLPRDWLQPETRAAAPVVAGATAPAAAPAPPPAAPLPDTLEAFLGWRVSGEAPDANWGEHRIAPSGPATGGLMILLDMPEPEDSASGVLASGAVGRLLDRMLAAIGHDRSNVHLASVCVTRPVTGQLRGDQVAKLAELARHHVALVQPRQLLLFGQAPSQAMLQLDGPRARGRLHEINHHGGIATAVVSFHPRQLLERPALKAEAWKDLQLLIGGSL